VLLVAVDRHQHLLTRSGLLHDVHRAARLTSAMFYAADAEPYPLPLRRGPCEAVGPCATKVLFTLGDLPGEARSDLIVSGLREVAGLELQAACSPFATVTSPQLAILKTFA
jgi:hypothetical protein